MIRQRLDVDSLFRVFTQNGMYSPSEKQLVRELATFIPGVVQTPDCVAHKPLPPDANASQRLHDILCEFSYAYSPLPSIHGVEKNQLVQRQIGNDSINGRVFRSVFGGNPIVTKAPIRWNKNNIIELFINFCIIDRFLLHGLGLSTFVASYGLFVCPTNIPSGIGRSLQRNEPLNICVGNVPNKKPVMFMVQQFVNGKTLGDFMSERELRITLAELKVYLHDIFEALIMMEQSPYRVAHNDLHVNNIMIADRTDRSPGKAMIIDWGNASFQSTNGVFYQPFYYDKYMGTKQENHHTGAYDAFELFKNLVGYTVRRRNPNEREIYAYAMDSMKSLLSMFPDGDFYFSIFQEQYFYLFDLLRYVENRSMNREKHKTNVDVLLSMTYRSIAKRLRIVRKEDRKRLDAIPYATLFEPPVVRSRAPPRSQRRSPPRSRTKAPKTPPRKQAANAANAANAAAPKRQCECKTLAGVQCKSSVVPGTRFCYRHQNCAHEAAASPPRAAAASPPRAAAASPPRAPAAPCQCDAILKTGQNKGRVCGKPCIHGHKCGIHSK